jgi:murein DD-endopeptidase MepM/ murein hydrolase activator NlpD
MSTWGSIKSACLGEVRPESVRAHLAVGIASGAALLLLGAGGLPSMAPTNRAAAAAAPAATHVDSGQVRGEQPRQDSAPADETSRRFSGHVGSDLSDALIAAGVPVQQGREYVALLARAIPLGDGLSVDDRFDLVLLRGPDGHLGQLVYAGLDRVARADVELMKWTDGKNIIWVNADGIGGESSEGIKMPVQGRLTSGFGNRFHPILGYERFHAGLDLAAPAGTPIVAAADGRVVSAGWSGGYGQAVEIAHSGGLETRYGHMSRIAAYAGELIHRGAVIGYVGSTGLSTGPHLHFEVLKNGHPVNPASVKLGGGADQLQGAQLFAFHSKLRQLLLN